jgi:hypothetical protein
MVAVAASDEVASGCIQGSAHIRLREFERWIARGKINSNGVLARASLSSTRSRMFEGLGLGDQSKIAALRDQTASRKKTGS